MLTAVSVLSLIALSVACDHEHDHGHSHDHNITKSTGQGQETLGSPLTPDSSSEEKKLVCYHGSWSVYRPDKGKFSVEDIDPFLCTHVIYGFTGLGHDNRIRPLDPWNDLRDNYGKGAFERFVGLKKKNPKLKTLIAIGGWNEGSVKYSMMAANPQFRKDFVDSCVKFLDKHKFDGLDLDWEYPGSRGGKPEDKQNFVQLLKEMKEAFSANNYLLTAAVSAGRGYADPAYDYPEVAKYLDIINLMAYDYHGGWEDKTGHNAPLYARPDETGDDRFLNVNYSVNYWLSQGVPKEKIVLGMGTYGRAFTLQRAEVNGFGAAAPQKGQAGVYTREPGSLGYNEICELQKRENWVIVKDAYHLAPYAYKERQWVGYDDIESITLKTRFAKYMGLAGAMIWSIETDDFRGECGPKFPLLNAIKDELRNSVTELPLPAVNENTTSTTKTSPISSTTTSTTPISTTKSTVASGAENKTSPSTPSTSTTAMQSSSSTTTMSTTASQTPQTTNCESHSKTTVSTQSTSTTSTISSTSQKSSSSTTPPPSASGFVCKNPGMIRDPQNCRKFYNCVEGMNGQLMIHTYECPSNTVFDNNIRVCMWPQSVPECRDYYKVISAKVDKLIL